MDALPPSLPNAGLPQPAPAGQAGLAILLAELTQALAELPAGTQIPAQVTAILPQATAAPEPAGKPPSPTTLILLATPEGPAQIRVPATLQIPVGAKLDITVAAAGPQPQWRLATIDGKPALPAPVTVVASPPSPPVSGPTPTVAPIANAPRPTSAPGIPATLIKSADPALPSGTTLLVRITNLVPPPTPQEQAPEQTPESPPVSLAGEPETAPSPAPTAISILAAAPVPTPAPPPAQTPVQPPVDTAAIQAPPPTATEPPIAQPAPITAPAPTQAPLSATNAPATMTIPAPGPAPTTAPFPLPTPTPAPALPPTLAPVPASVSVPVQMATTALVPGPTPANAPAPPPAEIGGEVLPNNDAGRPLVRSPVGLLALSVEPQAAPPAGAHVTLAIIGKPVPPPIAAVPPPVDDPPDKALPRRLADLVEQAQSSGNEKLAEAVRQAIPAPGPKLAAQLLSVIASAEQPSQGLSRWLGEGLAAALTHSAPEATAQLARQWETVSQPVQGPDNGEWRSLLLPLMMGGQMSLLRLTTRNPRRGATPAEGEKGTRFLLDLDLSRLGPMQFDGLVKRQHKHFDLIIRTRDPLPGEMRRDIDGLFLNGLLNFGLQGSVVFQADGRFVETPRLTGDANGIIFA